MKRKINLMIFVTILSFSFINIQASELKKSLKTVLEIGEQMGNMRGMLETYALIATNVSYKAPEKRLLKGILEYEGTINDIEKNYKDKEIVTSIKASKKAWKPVKKALLTAMKDNNSKRMMKEGLFIHANIRSVIKELENMKKYLLSKYNIKDEEELNAVIEIDASAQRLSAHYMLKMWGIPDPTVQEHWDNGVRIYKESIKVLKVSQFYKNPEFKKLLDSSEKNLKYFTMVITFEDKFVPVLVQDKSGKVCKSADRMGEILLDKITK
jgi:hypothetical protein